MIQKIFRSPSRRALRERWWLALAWLVLGAALAGLLTLERRDIELAERARLAHQASILQDSLKLQLQAIHSVLGELASRQASPAADDPQAHAIDNARLRAFSQALTGVRNITVFDAQGQITASSRADLIGQNFAWRDYFKAAKALGHTDQLLVCPSIHAVVGGWYLMLGRSIAASDGSFGGLVIATLEPEQLLPLLRSMRYAPDMRVGLMHGDGLRFLMVGEPGDEQIGPASTEADPLPAVSLAQEGSLFMRHRHSGRSISVLHGPILPGGRPMLAAIQTVSPPELWMNKALVIGLARDESAIFATWRTTAWVAALAWLLAGAVSAGMLLLVQSRRREAREHLRALAHKEQATEERWRAVLEATSLGVWEWRRSNNRASGEKEQHTSVYFSPSWKALLGFAPDEMGRPGFDWREYLHPDERERVLTELQRHLRGETALYETVHRVRRKDGSWRWVNARGRVLERDVRGRPVRFVGTYGEVAQDGQYRVWLDHLAANVPGALYQFQRNPDGSTGFPYASAGIEAIYGYPPEALLHDGAPAFARIHPDDQPQVLDGILESERSMEDWHAEYRVTLPGRGERWLSGQARPQRLASGGVLWHGYLRDITEAKREMLQQQETERLLQHLLNEMPIGLAMVDEAGRMYFRNRRFLEYFGWDEQDVATLEQWREKAYPDPQYRAQVNALWDRALAQAIASGGDIAAAEYRVHTQSGSERSVAIGGLAFGGHFLATFIDHTEQREHNDMLYKLAYVDALTGVPNRRHFDQSLDAEWRRCRRSGRPLALIMIDIDHFKQYNDLYGHPQGDVCMRAVAQALRRGLGRSHDMVARYGGEEFVGLLPECDLAGATSKARALRRAVQALAIPHAGSSCAQVVTVSIGVAVQVPEAHTRPEALLASADAYLYRAKASGRNRVENGQEGGADSDFGNSGFGQSGFGASGFGTSDFAPSDFGSRPGKL